MVRFRLSVIDSAVFAKSEHVPVRTLRVMVGGVRYGAFPTPDIVVTMALAVYILRGMRSSISLVAESIFWELC